MELGMARGKRHTAEQVVNLLRQIEVSVANGNGDTVANGRIVPTAQIVTGSQPKAKRVASFGWPSSLSADNPYRGAVREGGTGGGRANPPYRRFAILKRPFQCLGQPTVLG
jgi:hypothetical protein